MDERTPTVVDLAALAGAAGNGTVLWTRRTEDFNINVLGIGPETGIAEHVNAEVDVLVLAVAGEGSVEIDGEPYTLRPGQAIVIPKRTRRAIRSVTEPFTYMTCHRRRAGLWPEPPLRRPSPR